MRRTVAAMRLSEHTKDAVLVRSMTPCGAMTTGAPGAGLPDISRWSNSAAAYPMPRRLLSTEVSGTGERFTSGW
jgi:hypothetical protein